MKNVLMICYYYPPIGGIVAERPLAFSRLLPESGWRPVIITPRAGTLCIVPAGRGMEIPPGVVVRRTRNPDTMFRLKKALGFDLSQAVEEQLPGGLPADTGRGGAVQAVVRFVKNWMGIPDRHIDWYPFLVREAKKVIREERIDVIYSKSLPNTSALAAARLSRVTGLPWVAEIPDLWTHTFTYPRTGAAARLDRWLEGRTLARASAIITYHERTMDMLREAYPALRDRLMVIPHGYDETTYERVEPIEAGLFNVVYAGSIYYPFQDPQTFLEAIKMLRDKGEDLSRFRFQYLGRHHRIVNDLAESVGVRDLVETPGQVPYSEAIARQKGATALLYLQWEPGGEIGTYSKFAQYLGARRPVLAIAPTPGEADRDIAQTGAGAVARDAAGALVVLESWLAEYRANGRLAYRGDEATIKSYSYRNRSAQLAGVLDSVRGRGPCH